MPTTLTPRQRLIAVAQALARIDAAIESLIAARDRVIAIGITPQIALDDVDHAIAAARAGRAKLEITLRRCPPLD